MAKLSGVSNSDGQGHLPRGATLTRKRLKHDRHTRFLMGEAILRCLYTAAGKPKTWWQLDVVRALLLAHLSDEELHYVMVYSGWAVLDVLNPSEQFNQLDLPFYFEGDVASSMLESKPFKND
jgi:hypothetical protein